MPQKLPQSTASIIEDGDDVLHDQNVNPDEGVTFADVTKTDTPTADVATDVAAVAPAADEVPEQFKGKTPAQLVKMYQDLHSVVGRQGNELGELRRVSDEYIRANLTAGAARARAEAAASTPKQTAATDDDADFFAKPKAAIDKAIENHPLVKELRGQLGQQKQAQAVQRAQSNTDEFNKRHPDAGTILNDPEFQAWVGASKVRQALLKQAHQAFDLDAGDEVFATWKALQAGAKKPAPTPAQAAAAKKTALAAAKVPSGGNATPKETGGDKKIYRRADLVRLNAENPNRYAELSDEIALAYAEGRVR